MSSDGVLLRQFSRADCVAGQTFGCERDLIWVADGCRGSFRCCGGRVLHCGAPAAGRNITRGNITCGCTLSPNANTSHSRLGSSGGARLSSRAHIPKTSAVESTDTKGEEWCTGRAHLCHSSESGGGIRNRCARTCAAATRGESVYACTPGRCQIGSESWDGFGHQLDAKLSCIAVAAASDADYIHIPIHSGNKSTVEQHVNDFLSIGGRHGYRQWDDRSLSDGRSHRSRQSSSPWWARKDDSYCNLIFNNSWFPRSQRGNLTCCREHVYVADNCWDAFNCHPNWPGIWDNVAPAVREQYQLLENPAWDNNAPARQSSLPVVVVHYRCGGDVPGTNVQRRSLMRDDYYARAVALLRREMQRSGHPPPLIRIQTDVSASRIGSLLERIRALDNKTQPSLDVVIDDYRSPLQLAFYRMVTADALVMSKSSLSMAAAVLSTCTIVFPKCYRTMRRPLPHWRSMECSPQLFTTTESNADSESSDGTLLRRFSRADCVAGQTFGCERDLIWVAGGCRGSFSCCGGRVLYCGNPVADGKNFTCGCEHSAWI